MASLFSRRRWSFIDFAAENNIKIVSTNLKISIYAWIYHSKFLSHYALSNQRLALESLECALRLSGLPKSMEMQLLFDLCQLANQYCLWDMLRQALDRLDALSIEIGSKLGQAQAKYFTAALFINEGKYQEALDQYQLALAVVQKIEETHLESEILNDIGFCYRRLNDDDRAERFYKRSLELRRQGSDLLGMAESLNNLGLLFYDKGKLAESEVALKEALEMELKVGDRMGAGYTMLNLGYLMKKQGNLKEAIDLYHRALKCRKDIDDQLGMAYCYCQLSYVAEEIKDYHTALGYIEQAIENFSRAEDINGILEAKLSKVKILYCLDRRAEAKLFLKELEGNVNASQSERLKKRYMKMINDINMGAI